jgi:hypothetical protein
MLITLFKASRHVRLIRTAMDAVESVTCVRFKPRRYENDYVMIHSGQFCKSFLGRTGGPQEMSLNINLCFKEGIIIHELLHALGYIHMHNRPDRDKHVKILWNNIDQRFFSEFQKVDEGTFNYYGTPYDYQSIMHYGPTAFSKTGARTIIPKDSTYSDFIGQRDALSEGDIKRINSKYKCHGGGRSVLLSTLNHVRGKPAFGAFYDELADEAEEGEEVEELFQGRKSVKLYK